jgi:hypothetical protein
MTRLEDSLVTGYEPRRGLAQRDFVCLTSLLRIVLSIPIRHLPITSAYIQDVLMDVDLESHTVVDTFTNFLIVAIHQILRELNIYPPKVFLTAQKYSPLKPTPPPLRLHQPRHYSCSPGDLEHDGQVYKGSHFYTRVVVRATCF